MCAAVNLGVATRVLAGPDDQSVAVFADVTRGDPNDPATLDAFSRSCDVMTFDHERVDPDLVEALERLGRTVHPGHHVLRLTDKAHQRHTFSQLGYPVPRHAMVTTIGEVTRYAASWGGWPVVLKRARGGYDGRGVWEVEGEEQALYALTLGGNEPMVIEPHLRLDAELAVLVARRPGGQTVTYPVAQTTQTHGICTELIVPAPIDPHLTVAAQQLAAHLAADIGAVGILAVELFVVDGQLLINELAPRPHNSGHYTIEGCTTSQFQNHLRAILDLPLGPVELTAPAVATSNIIAREHSNPDRQLASALDLGAIHVHLYNKTPQTGRKLGHVTVTADHADTATTLARTATATLTRPPTPTKRP